MSDLGFRIAAFLAVGALRGMMVGFLIIGAHNFYKGTPDWTSSPFGAWFVALLSLVAFCPWSISLRRRSEGSQP